MKFILKSLIRNVFRDINAVSVLNRSRLNPKLPLLNYYKMRKFVAFIIMVGGM